MKVRNKSNTVIIIGGISLLPDMESVVPTGYENNPSLNAYASLGQVELIDEPKKSEKAEKVEAKEVIDYRAMSKAELLKIATEKGADVNDATTKGDLIKILEG